MPAQPAFTPTSTPTNLSPRAASGTTLRTDYPAPAAPLGTRTNPRPHPWPALAVSLALAYGVSALGALATIPAIPTWYAGLAKHPLTPPPWLFAPVWTALYTAMAVAAWLAWRTRRSSCRTRGLRLYAVQLLLNLSWTWIFFARHRPGAALLEIALLWAAIALTFQAFRRMSHLAAWLLAPYLAWVTYAAWLNWSLWFLNPQP